MHSKLTHNAGNRSPNTPHGASFPAWLSARYPHIPPATARVIAQHAGYFVRDEWTAFCPVSVEMVASATKVIEVTHAG